MKRREFVKLFSIAVFAPSLLSSLPKKPTYPTYIIHPGKNGPEVTGWFTTTDNRGQMSFSETRYIALEHIPKDEYGWIFIQQGL